MHQGAGVTIDQGSHGLRFLLEQTQLDAHFFTWFDTGTPSTLAKTRLEYKQLNQPNILEKKMKPYGL